MKIIFKRILEYLLLAIFCILLIFGNIFLVYNLKNKFENFNKKYSIEDVIENSEQVIIKDVVNNNEKIIDRDDTKTNLIDILSKLNIRKNKIKFLVNNDNKIDYSIYITSVDQTETIINFRENIIEINNEVFECDYKVYGVYAIENDAGMNYFIKDLHNNIFVFYVY